VNVPDAVQRADVWSVLLQSHDAQSGSARQRSARAITVGQGVASGWDGATCDGRLWIREAGAVTEKRWFCDAYSGSAVGFRPDGKAWVLDGLTDYGPETVDAMLFEEP